jgi:hypothetical protein
VRDYLRAHGARKCEANALVVRPDAGRQLCRDAIAEFVDEDAIPEYERRLTRERNKVKAEIARILKSGMRQRRRRTRR